MKRCVQIGDCTLYCGESLEILPEIEGGSIDALITDPPYSSGGFTRSDRNADPAEKYVQSRTEIVRGSFSGDNRDARSWCFWMALWLSEAASKMRVGGYGLIFTDWRQLPLCTDAFQAGGFVWRGLVVWDKTEGSRAPHTGYFRHQCEYVVWGSIGQSGAADWGGPWGGAIRVPVRQAEKFHMTGKPVEVMEHLVQCCRPGGIVLDPFMGSGTTGVAAIRAGRQFIGVEKSEEYFEVACDRIRRTYDERSNPLFSDVAPKQMELAR